MSRRKNQVAEPAAVRLLSLPDAHGRLVAELCWEDVHPRPVGYDGWVPEGERLAVARSERVLSLAESAGVQVVAGPDGAGAVTAADVDVMVAFVVAERAHVEASRLRSEAAEVVVVQPDSVRTLGVVGNNPAQVEAAMRERAFYAGLVPVKPGTYAPGVAATFGWPA